MNLVSSQTEEPIKLVTIKPCSKCQRLMRPRAVAAKDFPNTVREGSAGVCATCCYSAGPYVPAKDRAADPEQVQRTKDGLDDFLAARRARLFAAEVEKRKKARERNKALATARQNRLRRAS